MNRDLIKNKTSRIICRFLKLENSEIDERVTLPELGADSLDQIEIIWSIEKEFNILIQTASPENLYHSTFKNLCQEIDDALQNHKLLFA
jgi:acyl carrier protein